MATLTLRPNASGDRTELAAIPGSGEANWQDVADVSPDYLVSYVLGGASYGFNIYLGIKTYGTEYWQNIGALTTDWASYSYSWSNGATLRRYTACKG